MSNAKQEEPQQTNTEEQFSLGNLNSHHSVKISGCSQKCVNIMEFSKVWLQRSKQWMYCPEMGSAY